MYKKIIILGLITALSACGWHLRGNSSTTTDADTVNALSLTADDIYSPLYRTFKIEYEKRRIDLANTTGKPQLKLLAESTSTHILSLNNELDPAESEITFSVDYQITLSKLPPQLYHLQLYRTYTQDKNHIAARDNAKQKLIDEMRSEAAERVLNQIRTLSTSPPTINTNSAP